MRRNVLMLAGILVFAFGLLFTLQGLGVIRWPASSFMLGREAWVVRGGLIALIGAALMLTARLLPARG